MSRIRKELYFLTLIYGACVTGAIGPVIVPAFSLVAAEFKVTLQRVTMLNGSLIMALGLGSYVAAVLANVVGRRLLFLGTSVVLVVSCIWAAVAVSYGSLLAARVLQGLAMPSFFSVGGTLSIVDVFAVHERGRRVGLWNFAVLFAVNLTPIISGYLIMALNWRWAFWVLAIAFGVGLVLVCVFYPETQVQIICDGETADKTAQNQPKTPKDKQQNISDHSYVTEAEESAGTDFIIGLVEPLALLRHPVAIWSCLMWSIIFTWVIILGAVADQVFAAPPYSLKPSQVGVLVGVAPLIGSAIGTVFAGWMTDATAKFIGVRNNGTFEPEYRLVGVVPCLVGVAVGAFGLGVAIRDGLPPIVCGVYLACLNFGVGCGCTAIVTYTNDVCMNRTGQVFGLAMLAKSVFAFGLSFMLNDFYAQHGPVIFFSTWGALSTIGCLATIPMFIFGKRFRAFMGPMHSSTS
ncbi:MFS transporter [Periconia macrospinosa]|uniref:MFS transporter n=1 Tax=Periconia macrospinosa TaxID=97972 RepID=A0A2V1DRU7_9PLEO|nr:MFS transporter [Periconia macrospinosa]